jgi:hypothetical protein
VKAIPDLSSTNKNISNVNDCATSTYTQSEVFSNTNYYTNVDTVGGNSCVLPVEKEISKKMSI